jgi:hypothetical protein
MAYAVNDNVGADLTHPSSGSTLLKQNGPSGTRVPVNKRKEMNTVMPSGGRVSALGAAANFGALIGNMGASAEQSMHASRVHTRDLGAPGLRPPERSAPSRLPYNIAADRTGAADSRILPRGKNAELAFLDRHFSATGGDALPHTRFTPFYDDKGNRSNTDVAMTRQRRVYGEANRRVHPRVELHYKIVMTNAFDANRLRMNLPPNTPVLGYRRGDNRTWDRSEAEPIGITALNLALASHMSNHPLGGADAADRIRKMPLRLTFLGVLTEVVTPTMPDQNIRTPMMSAVVHGRVEMRALHLACETRLRAGMCLHWIVVTRTLGSEDAERALQMSDAYASRETVAVNDSHVQLARLRLQASMIEASKSATAASESSPMLVDDSDDLRRGTRQVDAFSRATSIEHTMTSIMAAKMPNGRRQRIIRVEPYASWTSEPVPYHHVNNFPEDGEINGYSFYMGRIVESHPCFQTPEKYRDIARKIMYKGDTYSSPEEYVADMQSLPLIAIDVENDMRSQ